MREDQWRELRMLLVQALGEEEGHKEYEYVRGMADKAQGEKCPNDTDGDGNCGKPACPVCRLKAQGEVKS